MNLEEKKVLKSRLNIFRSWREKEWWFTGFYDPCLNIYFSFFFARTYFTDQFNFILFDPSKNLKVEFSKNLYLEKYQATDKLCLNYNSKNLIIGYNGDEISGWKFIFKNKDYNIELDMKPDIPYFTKFDNDFLDVYTLLHFFHNRASGSIQIPGRTYNAKQALCYYDHCFGRVPSQSGWHWIAVQNEDIALASLVNYGANPQKYTQIYFKNNSKGFRLNQWIRLDQDVSFEYNCDKKFDSDWRVTSCDMNLVVTPISYVDEEVKIPPVIPFLINISHFEFFVKISGEIRIDSVWVDIKDLYGVMEEHHGKW